MLTDTSGRIHQADGGGQGAQAQGRWRIKAAIVLVYMVFGALLNSVGPIILLVVQSLGVSRSDAALLDAYKDLPIAIVSFFVASLLPRLGLKSAMLLGLVLVGAGCVAMPLIGAFWAIKLQFATIGAAFSLVKVAAYSSISLITQGEKAHASFMSVLEGMFMFGVLGGYWLFSLAASGQEATSTQWLNVYWVLAALIAVSFILLWLAPLDETRVREDHASSGRSVASDFIAMWRLTLSKLVAVFLLSAFLYVLVEQGVATWLPTFNRDVLNMPTSMSVGLAVLMPASTAVGRLLSAVVIARFGWYPVVMACVAAVAALIVVTMPLARGVSPDPQMTWLQAPLVAYLIPLIGFFLAPIYPAINSAMLSALPPARHAAMTGLIVVFSALGGAFGSFVTGRLFVAFDGPTAFTSLVVPACVLTCILWMFRGKLLHSR